MLLPVSSIHDLLAVLFTFLTSLGGIALISLGIALWGAYSYWWGFKRSIKPLVRDLQLACAGIERTRDEAEFAGAYQEVDGDLRANRLLADTWQEFADTLLFPGPADEPVVRNVQPPTAFFRRDVLLGRKLNLRYYNALPNLLTGAGILGTFIGLVAGIYLASGNLASDDISLAKQAMQQLLNGASLAFFTSIMGLIASISFSVGEKRWVHRFDDGLGRWVAGLDKRLKRMTSEELAREQLRQSYQQTEVLQGFTEQLAFQVAEAFDQRLQQHVTTSIKPALDTLIGEIQGLRGDRQSSDQALLSGVVEQFTTQLNGAAGSEMQALAVTLGELNDKLHAQTAAAEEHHRANQEAARESMDTLGRLFNEGTEGFQRRVGESVDAVTTRFGGLLDSLSERQAEAVRAAEAQITQVTEAVRGRIEESVAAMTTNMERLLRQLGEQQKLANADAQQRLRQLGETFNRGIADLRETLAQVRALSDANVEVMGRVTGLVDGLTTTVGALERTSAPISQAADRLETTGTRLGELVDAVGEAADALDEAAAGLRESNAATRAAWGDYQHRFEGIDEALGRTFEKLHEGLLGYTTQVGDFVGKLDQHTGDITGKLAGATEGLTETLETLSDEIARLDGLTQTMNRLNDSFARIGGRRT